MSRRQNLLVQLDNLIPEDIADSWEAYSFQSPSSSSSTSRRSSRNSLASAMTTETVASSIPTTPERKTNRNHHTHFQSQIATGNSSIHNVTNMLDCIEDMIVAETEEIERQLRQFIATIDASVPSNTYVVPVYPQHRR